MINRICRKCGVEFTVRYPSSKKVYCSISCGCSNSGGYREGSGRAKTGYYKGIYCGSTFELVWVIYNLDHQIPFTRFEGCIEGAGIKYFPDFLQNNTIVEIKGFEDPESVRRKSDLAISLGYKIEVKYKSDLIDHFKYVSERYGTTKFYELYDEYSPKFVYSCSHCSKEVSRDRESKFEKVFCSRSCALKGNRTSKGKNQFTKLRDAAGVATSPSN